MQKIYRSEDGTRVQNDADVDLLLSIYSADSADSAASEQIRAVATLARREQLRQGC